MVARWFSRPVGSPSRRAGSNPVARSWLLLCIARNGKLLPRM